MGFCLCQPSAGHITFPSGVATCRSRTRAPILPLPNKRFSNELCHSCPEFPVPQPGSAASGLLRQGLGLRCLSKCFTCQKPGLGQPAPAGLLASSSCTAGPLHLLCTCPALAVGTRAENQEAGKRKEKSGPPLKQIPGWPAQPCPGVQAQEWPQVWVLYLSPSAAHLTGPRSPHPVCCLGRSWLPARGGAAEPEEDQLRPGWTPCPGKHTPVAPPAPALPLPLSQAWRRRQRHPLRSGGVERQKKRLR